MSWVYWHQQILLDASIQFLDQISKSAATSVSAIFFWYTIPLGFLLKLIFHYSLFTIPLGNFGFLAENRGQLFFFFPEISTR